MIKIGDKENCEKQIRSILISQPRPDAERSPYFELAKKFDLQLDFHPFFRVEGLAAKEFRKQRLDILSYTAIIFTSRHAIDHYFRICEELKIKVSPDCKYFCITESVALYLQKFILYRKRKVFFGSDGTVKGLLSILNRHKTNERFLIPCSNISKEDIANWLKKNKCNYSKAILYQTVCNDDVKEVLTQNNYDLIVFFSPSGVKSLFENLPQFKQNGTSIAAFGPTTSKAVEESGLRLDLKVPLPNAPSMVAALELFLTDGIVKK